MRSSSSKLARARLAIARRRWLQWLAWGLLAASLAPLIALAVLHAAAYAGSYPVEDLAPARGSTRVFDARGRLLREAVAGGARAEWVALDQISPLAVRATIAAEDARFYDHGGVDWRAVVRASGQLVRHRRAVSGASTISMQVVRLVHPHERGWLAKAGEMIDALRVERAVDKPAILEQYLNRSPFGANTIGIAAASRRYFGKPAHHLSLAEAALLAGLPQAPARLDPLGDPAPAKRRQRIVLERMAAAGMITAAEHARALAEPLQFVTALPPPAAMHFTEWVIASGRTGDVATTLDADLQSAVEAMVSDHVAAHALAGMTDAAVVVLDNARCAVLAMVGSPDYRDPRGGAVNAALARRQPGSTLKPFTYALAFERGDTPATAVADIETRYGAAGGFLFAPQNYSHTFAGPVLADEALGKSLNIPAMRVLERVGVPALLDRLHALGFASLDRSAAHYGLGLTLGSGEVTLVELAQAYAALARAGTTCTATPFPDGETAGARAFSPVVSWLVTDILSDASIRAAAFGPDNALMLGYPVAVKTGTSSNWRDSWAIGYTPRFTVAVWAGDYRGRSMNKLAGAAGAGPLFRRVMNRLVERRPPTPVPPPAGVVEVEVCAVSGLRPGPHCHHTRGVHVPRDRMPAAPCEWHRTIAIDTRNGLRAGDRCPARYVEQRAFEVLPPPYSGWLHTVPGRSRPPDAYSPLCPLTGAIRGTAAITYPRDGEIFLVEPGYDARTQTVTLTADIDPPGAAATWFVDGRALSTAREPAWPLVRGTHRIHVEAGGRASDPVTIEVR